MRKPNGYVHVDKVICRSLRASLLRKTSCSALRLAIFNTTIEPQEKAQGDRQRGFVLPRLQRGRPPHESSPQRLQMPSLAHDNLLRAIDVAVGGKHTFVADTATWARVCASGSRRGSLRALRLRTTFLSSLSLSLTLRRHCENTGRTGREDSLGDSWRGWLRTS